MRVSESTVTDSPSPPACHGAGAAVHVEESGTERLGHSIQAGHRSWCPDEPPGIGDDTGPSPHDLLLSALESCTSMTLRLYADRKGFPLDTVAVTLTHRRSHHAECEAADRCPVHRTLIWEITITTPEQAAVLAP